MNVFQPGVREATFDELPTVGRLRYTALTSDAGFQPTPQMQSQRQLVDVWDPLSVVLVAAEGTTILGTFRVLPLSRVLAHHGRLSALQAFGHLGLERALEVFPIESVNVVGRLAVAPSHRGSRIVVDLLATAIAQSRERGERLSLADCSPQLLRLYERLAAFFPSGPNYHDEVFGVKTPIMGVLGDHQALERATIGFAAACYPDDPEAREFRIQVLSGCGQREAASTSAKP